MCIDFHQTRSVGKGCDHLQLIKFWPSCVPGKGFCGGAKISGSTLLQPARIVCVSSERFFHDVNVELKTVDELKSSISQLYSSLNVEECQLEYEHRLQTQLDDLRRQIEPFEQVHHLSVSLCLSLYVSVFSLSLCLSLSLIF